MKKSALFVVALALGLVLGALVVGAIKVGDIFGSGPDPETVAASSLQSVREQARLTPFSARFVAVVTASQSRFGLSAQKTLIMPGTVRYELDLAKMQQSDLRWDEAGKRLSITLPPLEIAGPEIHLADVQEYSAGGLLMSLGGTERVLDQANRQRAQQELVKQARQAMPLKLARDAAKRAVERSFAMPLKAAGIEATVVTRFRDEPSPDPSQIDRSRPMEEVLKERQAAR
ncbi:MAG TPA: DUF4230 domain-containing protein [Allosphingosinicella sp.]|jgi:hypothetical protein